MELSSATGWWETLVGRPPEALTVRQGAILEAVGPIDSGILALVFSSLGELRTDFLLNPPLPVEQTFPTLGDATAAIDSLSQIVEKWFDVGVPIRRLGVGGVVHSQVASVSEGYAALTELLPAVSIDPHGSSELMYQINRPRTSQVASLSVNRLTKWSVAARHHLAFSFAMSGAGGSVPSATAVGKPTSISIRLEFDINTAPSHSEPLATEIYKPLLKELIAFAQEILVKGDVP